MKTVRFSLLVAQCGPPEPYTLWSAPEQDRKFQSALKQHRVLSVHQETVGSKKDYGEVGFKADKQGSLLLFQKSLKAFEGRRVVGVKYDLLVSPPPANAVSVQPNPKKRPPAKPARKSEFVSITPAAPVPEATPEKDAEAKLERLTRLVRRALKELKEGKAVAAYQTLEKALPK